MKEWFKNNKRRIVLGLSYDGTDEMQDINRTKSSSLVDKKFFYENWPKQPIKMTISKQTVSNIAEGIIDLHNNGFLVNANLAYGTGWEMTESLGDFYQQLKVLADFYINNPEVIPSSLLNLKLAAVLSSGEKSRSCGTGNTMCNISQDGIKYPCHMFMESSLSKKINIEEIYSELKKETLLDGKCLNCYMERVCPTCYGMNFIVHQKLTTRGEDYCKMMKLRALAATYMYGVMLSTDTNYDKYVILRDFSDGLINAYKKAIYILQKNLKKDPFIKTFIDNVSVVQKGFK